MVKRGLKDPLDLGVDHISGFSNLLRFLYTNKHAFLAKEIMAVF